MSNTASQRAPIDMTGQLKGRWQVVEYAGRLSGRGNRSGAMWRCRCTGCQMEKKIKGQVLRNEKQLARERCRRCDGPRRKQEIPK